MAFKDNLYYFRAKAGLSLTFGERRWKAQKSNDPRNGIDYVEHLCAVINIHKNIAGEK